MVPVPIEGHHPAMIAGPISGIQAVGAAAPPGGGTISLGMLIDFSIQQTYHELSVLAELMPRKNDIEKKIAIVKFASKSRQLFVRLLALVKWASSASKVEKCSSIMGFLDKQSMLFVETADMLSRMARETLVHARLPNFHLPCAVEVLTTGTYLRLPTCIRDKIVPPEPITTVEKKSTLQRLNQIIQHRLVTSELPSQMKNLKIENGRVTFHVEHEFKISLTMMGDNLVIPWRLLGIEILVEDKETGDGKTLVHSLQVQYIEQLIQSRLVDNSTPLHDIYDCLHSFCQSLQLEVLHSQAIRLMTERLGDYIKVEEYNAGKNLTISYWREIQSKESENLGFKITVQVNPSYSCKPLMATHSPLLNTNESAEADSAIKCDHLSIEKLLVQTIYIRTKQKLNELKDHIMKNLTDIDWSVSGSPAILQVSVLQPCLRAEQLLISIDTHSGIFLAHIPKYEIPIMNEIQQVLNFEQDTGRTKFIELLRKLRFWMTYRRCEKSLSHLPALAMEKLPLIVPDDHEINKLGPYKLFVKLRKHPNCFLVVDLIPDPDNQDNVTQEFYMLLVKPVSYEDEDTTAADPGLDISSPKAFLRISTFIKLDSFGITHGSCTAVEVAQDVKFSSLGKRSGIKPASAMDTKRAKYPAYFMPKLAHVIAVCDERVPFAGLIEELSKRDIAHQGMQVEAHGSNLAVGIVKLPQVAGVKKSTTEALHGQLLSCTFRIQGKTTRCWLVEYIFCKCPLPTSTTQELDSRRPVYFLYELSTSANIHKVVDSFTQDWAVMCQLYEAVLTLASAIDQDTSGKFSSVIEVKSYTYKRLVLKYGPNKAYIITIQKRAPDKGFHLTFGIGDHTASAINPHCAISLQLHHVFNQNPDLVNLINILQETLPVLNSLYKLSIIPMLGIMTSRPKVPFSTFIIIPQSPTHYKLVYRSMYCLDVQCRDDGLIAVRDGVFSLFDKGRPMNEFMPIQGLKLFLGKYADESSTAGNAIMMQRRGQNQTDDDNPPSPVSSTIDPMETLMGPDSASPAQRSQDSAGLRFTHPMTPPSVSSNPHTPASPHASVMSQQSFSASPAASSFPLASPPSLQHNINPSPSMMHINTPSPATMLSANSPGNPLHAPSPGGAFLPTPSPSSQTQVQHMQSPAQSFIAGHTDSGSPFPPTSYATMPSPAAPSVRWANSPSVPGPSPASRGMAQSPGGSHLALQSPQAGSVPDLNAAANSRVMSQRSWAAAVPTLLSNESFSALCSPGPIQMSPGTTTAGNLSPLERYMGCSYMKRNIMRVLQNDDSLTLLQSQEPSGILFKVESLQCKVALNSVHNQTLHLKLNPTPEYADQWQAEDLLILEKFFDTKVASHPYKPNAFVAFCKIITTPFRILKDCIVIMKIEMVPERMAKWSLEWLMTTPVAAPPIAPPGMNGVILISNKILLYFQLTRIGLQLPSGTEPQNVIVPIVYDMSNNITQMADKRDNAVSQPTAPYAIISNTLKRFTEVNPRPTNECSISPAIRELITNLVIPLHNAP